MTRASSFTLPIVGTLFLAGCADPLAAPPTSRGAVAADDGARTWVVAFKGQGLPADVDAQVASAGGTIIARMPEIGGIAVSSSRPDFGAAVATSSSVLAADIATKTQLIRPGASGPELLSATDNGGTYSPTGSDLQPMPDPLGY